MKHEVLSKQELYERFLEGLEEIPGIYAITIDNRIVYIGKSKNVRKRARSHIRNAYKGHTRAKYGLLSEAINKKSHIVRCKLIIRCSVDELDRIERDHLDKLYLPLNTMMSKASPLPKYLRTRKLYNILRKCDKWHEGYSLSNRGKRIFFK